MLSATVLVARFPLQQNLALVRIHQFPLYEAHQQRSTFPHVADPPRVTTHPKGLKDAVPHLPVTFTVRATGTEPLNYQWQWKPAADEQGSEEWQLCDMESSDGTTLKIPSIQKLNEGSYQCVISNCAGSQTSEAAKLSIGKNPHINSNCMKHLISVLHFHM